jgi:proline racemase
VTTDLLEEPIRATDYHTAGEPFRIVTSQIAGIPGDTVADRRMHAMRSPELDRLRRFLCYEPRGHADMYGCFLVPPDDDGGDAGVLFWHKDGFSTACGHGTVALATWLVETGRVEAASDGVTDLAIDVPSGRVIARVSCEAGRVQHVVFRNVASFVLARSVPVETRKGTVYADLAYGGAVYASLDAQSAGLSVSPDHYADLIAVGREIKWALDEATQAQHPSDPRLSGVYGTIWYDDLGSVADGIHQRNVTVFADGEVDRSPCGSGTAARVALLADEGRLAPGQVLIHESIIGTRFTAWVAELTAAEGRPAVVAEIQGNAFITGEHVFVLDPRDELGTGFVLR